VWLYHSHVDEIADTNAGLIGTIIVTRKGAAKSPADPAPADVDREFVALFSIMNELQSVYALNNTVELALGGNSTQEAVDELLSVSPILPSKSRFKSEYSCKPVSE
jgi:hypothetical protein